MDAAPPAPPIELSRLECLGGVIVSPAKAFEQLSRKPQWLMPLVIIMLWALVELVLRTAVVMAMAFSRFSSQAAGQPLGSFTPVMRIFVVGFSSSLYFVGGVGGAIVLLIAMTYVVLLLARAFGSKPTFFPLLSCLAYAEFVPRLARISLKHFIPLMTGKFGYFKAELPTGLMELVKGVDFPEALNPLLGRIELFHAWSFVLVVILLQKTLRLERNKAVLITALYWLVCVVFLIGGTFLKGIVTQAITSVS